MLNLGGLFFTLDADTRGLQTAQRRVESFANTVRQAFRGVSAGTVDSSFANALNRQERAVVASMERIKRVQDSVSRAGFTGNNLTQARAQLEALGNSYNNFTRKMAAGIPLNNLDFGRRVQQMNSQINDVTRNIQRLRAEASRSPTGSGWGNLANILRGVGDSALLMQGHFGGVSTRLFAMTGLIRNFGLQAAIVAGLVTGLAAAMVLLGDGTLKTAIAIQQVEFGLTAIAHNSAIAAAQLGFVHNVANEAGVQFLQAARQFQTFNTAATLAGMSGDSAARTFRNVALAAGTLHLAQEDVQGVFTAFEQMLNKGKVVSEELRRQLANRLPGAFEVAAQSAFPMARNVSEAMRQMEAAMRAGTVRSAQFLEKFSADYVRAIGATSPDTLQANLNRSATAITDFFVALDRATNASGVANTVIKLFNSSLIQLAVNMRTLLGVVAAVAGAMAGLAAVMAVVAFQTWAAGIWTAVVAFIQMTSALRLSTVALIGLNVAMNAIPWAAIAGLVIRITAAVAGAYLGYTLMTEAVDANNQALSNISGIEAYITAQERMGTQVRSTTLEMIRQLNVQAQTAANNLRSTAHDYADVVRQGGPVAADYLDATAGNWFGGQNVTGQDVYNYRLNSTREAYEGANRAAGEYSRTIAGLDRVSQLPETAGLADSGGGTGGHQRGLDGITNKIKDLQDAARIAGQQLDAMMAPITDGQNMRDRIERLGDLGDALRAVNNLNPAQRARAASLLGVPNDINAITQSMTGLITRTREANEVTQDFSKIWADIEQGMRQHTALRDQIEMLNTIGGDVTQAPGAMRYFENFARAQEMIERLQRRGPAGAQALQSLATHLHSLGIETNDVTVMLAQFFDQIQQGQEQVRVIQEMGQKFRELHDTIQRLQALQGAISGSTGGVGRGLLGRVTGGMFAADTGEAATRAITRGEAVRAMRRSMEEANIPQEQINQRLTEYLGLLRQVDDNTYVYDRLKQAAERTRDSFRSMVRDGLTNLRDLLSGVKSLGNALKDLALNILNSLWERHIMQPIDDLITNMGHRRGEKAVGGLDAQIGGIGQLARSAIGAAAANDNLAKTVGENIVKTITKTAADVTATGSMSALTSSAFSAAAALQAVAVSGGGGGKGGFLKTILDAGLQVAGAAAGGKGSIKIPGKAMGGYVGAGQIYNVNEPGISGEYFIPRVNGYMSPNHPGGNGSTNIVQLGDTHIDMRGATTDAVSEMKRYMDSRDRQLRADLPHIIDGRFMDSAGRRRYGT